MDKYLTTLREMRDEIDEYLQTPGPDDEEFRKERDALDAAILALEVLPKIRYYVSTHNLNSQENPCECDMCMIHETFREFDEKLALKEKK